MGLLCCQTETIQDKVSIVNKVNLNQGTNVFTLLSDLPINHCSSTGHLNFYWRTQINTELTMWGELRACKSAAELNSAGIISMQIAQRHAMARRFVGSIIRVERSIIINSFVFARCHFLY